MTALLTLWGICAIFNLMVIFPVLTDQDLHDSVQEQLKKENPDHTEASRLFIVASIVFFAPFFTVQMFLEVFK